MSYDIEARMTELNRLLPSMPWELVCAEVRSRIADLTASLVAANNEETRGAIKALMSLLDLPVALEQEREGLTAELPEESDSAP